MGTDKFKNSNSGFTLVEVLVSVVILTPFVLFAASMLTNSQLLASYSKHKIQAAYVAQQLIETERQNISTYTNAVGPILSINPRITLGNGHISVANPYIKTGPVTLDTKGIYPATGCSNTNLPCALATITVTPAVYTPQAGPSVTSAAVYHFVVAISWNEQILKSKVPMTETYAEDIANDPMLN